MQDILKLQRCINHLLFFVRYTLAQLGLHSVVVLCDEPENPMNHFSLQMTSRDDKSLLPSCLLFPVQCTQNSTQLPRTNYIVLPYTF